MPNGRKADDRVRRSREVVLKTTAELMVERGFGGTTVDEIARRSGVAKTTIYRHWPTRGDLLRDACGTLATPLAAPDTGRFETDMAALLAQLAHLLRTAQWPAVLPSVIDAAERDPVLAAAQAKLQAGYAAPFEAVIRRGIGRGDLPKGTDVSILVAALTGALFYRRWFSREPLTDDIVDAVLATVTRSAP